MSTQHHGNILMMWRRQILSELKLQLINKVSWLFTHTTTELDIYLSDAAPIILFVQIFDAGVIAHGL